MEFARIHATDLTASRIGLGTWAIGGWMWGGTDERISVRTIHTALDSGINLIDTAPVYGFGRSEEIVGKALAQYGRRQESWSPPRWVWNGGRTVWCATPAGNVSCARWMTRCAGFVPTISTSTRSTGRMRQYPSKRPRGPWINFCAMGRSALSASATTRPGRWTIFAAARRCTRSNPRTTCSSGGSSGDVLPYCEEHAIAAITYGALCRGLLSGRMRPETRFHADDLRQMDPKFQEPHYAQYLKTVESLAGLARDKYGKTVLQLAVRWLLDRPGVTAALWGARSPEQLEPISNVVGWRLDPEDAEAIDGILEQNIPNPIGPEFMAPPSRRPPEAPS